MLGKVSFRIQIEVLVIKYTLILNYSDIYTLPYPRNCRIKLFWIQMRKPACNRIFRYFVNCHLTSMGRYIIKNTILRYTSSSSSTTCSTGSSTRSAWCMALIPSSHGSILSELVLWNGCLLHVSGAFLIWISWYAPTSQTLSDSRLFFNRSSSWSKSFIKSCSKFLSVLFVFLTGKYMTFWHVTKGNNFNIVKLILLLQVLREIKLIFKALAT